MKQFDNDKSSWSRVLCEKLGVEIREVSLVSGGDFAAAYRMVLEDGQLLFAKTHHDPPPNFFSTEAAGLQWLSEAGGVRVPSVELVCDQPPLLVLKWVDTGHATLTTERDFGRELAKMHSGSFSTFGRPDGNTTGSQAMDNTPCDSWAQFYAERRLLPLSERAATLGSLRPKIVAGVQALAEDLSELVGSEESPSLLHGDLWAQNRIVDRQGRSWLIDPAAFGGSREFDLAIMKLFGGFGVEVFSAYDEVYPLADDWLDRVPLYQLATLIVHAIKFHGGYPSAVQKVLASYGYQ